MIIEKQSVLCFKGQGAVCDQAFARTCSLNGWASINNTIQYSEAWLVYFLPPPPSLYLSVCFKSARCNLLTLFGTLLKRLCMKFLQETKSMRYSCNFQSEHFRAFFFQFLCYMFIFMSPSKPIEKNQRKKKPKWLREREREKVRTCQEEGW